MIMLTCIEGGGTAILNQMELGIQVVKGSYLNLKDIKIFYAGFSLIIEIFYRYNKK